MEDAATSFLFPSPGDFCMLRLMAGIALTELLGATVYDANGTVGGRVREVAVIPQDDLSRIAAFVVRTREGDRLVAYADLAGTSGTLRTSNVAADWVPVIGSERMLLLERDLLDQQVIDVHGRKVVRVNDVDIFEETVDDRPVLKVNGVDVGARGAVRRLLRGLVPRAALRAMLRRIPPRTIPWEFVDLIETDPARRVKLKISHDRLAQLHPADIADIVENLAPDEREAVFETLDEGVAAEALEEVEPKLQSAIVQSLDSDRAADIVEEMDPDAAADLLGELPEEHSEKILSEMEPEERQEVADLLEFGENTAAGRMNSDFLSVVFSATVHDAIGALRQFEGGAEGVSTIFLTDSHGTLVGSVPLARIVLARPEEPMLSLVSEPLISCHADAKEEEFTELIDKYNLPALAVVDHQKKLVGVVTSDDVIALLRAKL
jgi:CBS domain-containing protein